ncbi:anaphase-promoting complex subunit 1 [Anopheles bellator]|uniref:anaphase-promoting complex subunit 1 n=1 Tax=Anopheles bellator TaxID=139047 RepID=UPI00264933A6|nr:anaphase-promoting complex subunit 1 [Anopheles bellator]
MITASEPLEFIPRGRQAVEQHTGPITARQVPPAEFLLLQRMQDVNLSLDEEKSVDEFYTLRAVPIGSSPQRKETASGKRYELQAIAPFHCTEEELYVRGSTAVWTRNAGGSCIASTGLLQTALTCDNAIKFAFFAPARFLVPDTEPAEKGDTGTPRTGICLVDRDVLQVYCDTGETYAAKVECPIAAIWLIPCGILLEKDPSRSVLETEAIPMPRLFTLTYPTDDMRPVLLQHASSTSVATYLTEPQYRVVFTCEQLELVLLYDKQRDTHFVCRLRPASECPPPSECPLQGFGNYSAGQKSSVGGRTSTGGQYITPSTSMYKSSLLARHHNASTTQRSLASSRVQGTDLGGSGGIARDSNASLDATTSSMVGGGRASSSLAMSQLSFLQSMLCEEVNDSHDHRRFGVAEPSKPITAEYALKHIWTEEHTTSKGSPYGCVGEAATLGFLHTDLVDNRYLCYLRPKKMCLTLLQYEPATNVICKSHKISARAAVSIERLNMIVVIAPSGKLMLYSGPSSVGKIHMTGPLTGCFLTSTTTGIVTTTTTASATNAPFLHPPLAPGAQPTVSSFGALPRRSSLLPNATAHVDSKFEEELHLLSPVRPLGATTSSTVASSFGTTFPQCTTLRDAIDDRFTLVFDNERLYRVTLPPVTESQLIRRALVVLRHVLPDNIALEFFIRWYGARNAPGSQEFSTHQEWEQFRGLLFIMLGRPPSPGSLCPSSPGEEPKKRRKDESHHGTGSDWEFLLHHATYQKITKPIKAYEGTSPRPYQQHDQRPLYPHLAELWQALHLLYEDFRLDKGFRDEQHLLGEFLYSLASDAQNSAFQEHYINDIPNLAVCQLHSRYRITDPAVLARLATSQRGEFEGEVIPHVLRYMEDLVYRGTNPGEQLDIFPCLPGINDLTRDMLLLIALIYRVRSLTPWIKQQLESLAIPIGDWTATDHPPKGEKTVSEDDSSSAGRSLGGLTIVRIMIERGYTRDRIDHLPPAIRYVLLQCLESYRRQPQHGLTGSVYELLMRPELNAHGVHESANSLSSKTAATIDDALIQWLTDASEPDGGGTGGTGASIGVLGGSSSSASGRDDGGGGGSCNGGGCKLEPDDGMDGLDGQLLALRFPDDKRIEDVRSFLDSSQRVLIDIPQAPSVSDHDFLEDQEKRLYAISLRTMALPVGRGMFTLATYRPQETQTMPIPKLCLSGKEALRGATIEIHQIEVPTNMGLWPSFHNGVAAGLRITPSAPNLTSTWIKHNAPGATGKSTGTAAAIHPEAVTEHGGFLLALGLSGHLRHLSPNSIFDYMVNGDEMVRLGLLLGLSATHRGTMDLVTTKLLSVHMEALLPPTAVELDISQNLQIATLMGVGLLYQGSARSHIAEVLLQEIGRPPGPEMENCVERESYSLTAGLALGLVTLGEGDRSTVLRDLELPDTLHYYMHGGARRQVEGAQKEKYKLPSFQIREGGTVNIDVTAPGATLALGLMYHRTGNEAIAGWLQPPATNYELSYVRPDLLLLRGIARHLILWDAIEPTPAWVQQHVPPVLDQTVANVERYHEAYRAGEGSAPPDLGPGVTGHPDWLNLPLSKSEGEIYCQAYCNILSSGAIAIGLRYAGTADPTAADTLYDYLSYFITVRQQAPVGKLAGSQAVENCTMMVLLALSLVLAGTGNLRVLRVIRMLRARVGRCYVTYGSFMAVHMALGFLFLGGGRYTLSRSPAAIAALVCALFPKFPTYSNDNRYHLQAFRHLYVLALEPRLLVPRSISDAGLCLCRIEYVTRDQPNESIRLMAPCMLPELATLIKVCIIDDSYWHICFHKPNWHLLEKILRSCGYVEVQQRVGRLSRIEDPSRQRTLRLQTLTSGRRTPWKFDPQQLLEFDSQPMVLSLVRKLLLLDHYSALNEQLEPDRLTAATVDGSTLQLLVPLVSECVMHDRIHALSIFMDLSKILIEFKRNANTADAWQVRLFMAIIHNQLPLQDPTADRLLNDDILRSLINRIWMECERDLPRYSYQMKHYLGFGVSGQQTWKTIAEHLCELVPISESCSSNVIAANERREAELTALLRLIVLYDLPHDLLRNFVSNVFPGRSPLADELRFQLDIQTKLPTRSIDLIVCLFDTGFETAS